MSTIRTVIVGTAGHIDHGKSSLVRRLTGVDPDRLEEERSRGMTIDLGFAPYEHRSGATVGMIDVPGHERFIKNMVAGATSVDLALLVVAADDGVMPQTQEHLAILELLGVPRGVVALTKIDLVEADLVELAQEELREALAGTFLADAPVVPVSSHTGQGLDLLRAALDDAIEAAVPHAPEGPFRLPVQRVFSAKGHGLVVTGVPISGVVRPGESLEIVRTGQRVRVRAVQAYGLDREQGQAGHSTALNLAGASKEDVTRGDVVGFPGAFRSSRFIALNYRHVAALTPLRPQHPVRLHVGTSEVLGRALPLADADAELTAAPVQLRLDDAVCCALGDRVVLRDAASLHVLGGGTVLALGEGRLKRGKARVLGDLEARREALGDPRSLIRAVLLSAGPRGASPETLVKECGLASTELESCIAELQAEGALQRAGNLLVGAEALTAVADGIVEALKHGHRARPLLDWLDQASVLTGVSAPDAVLRAALLHDGRLETAPGGKLRRKGHRGRLGEQLGQARERVAGALLQGDLCPPAVGPELAGLSAQDTRALLEFMREEGELIGVGEHLFHREALAKARRILAAHGQAREGAIDIPTLRDELGTTRKFLIPLLEAFDAEGLTVRHGDRRVLRRRESPA